MFVKNYKHMPPMIAFSTALASASGVDLDDHGNVGRELPSGEFQLILPTSIPRNSFVSVVHPYPNALARRDARLLRMGEVQGLEDYVPSGPKIASLCPTPIEKDVLVVEPLHAALQLEKNVREQAEDADCQRYAASAGDDSLFDLRDLAYSFEELPSTVPCNFLIQNRYKHAFSIWSNSRVQRDTLELPICSVPFDGGSSGRAWR
jgi:hypothetical protein